jgi:hypothetical protein
MGDEVTDVSVTVSNASPTCLVFRLASLDWMVNNTDEYGSFGGLADSRAPDIGFSVLPDLFGVCCS